jgi:hypothetical protein
MHQVLNFYAGAAFNLTSVLDVNGGLIFATNMESGNDLKQKITNGAADAGNAINPSVMFLHRGLPRNKNDQRDPVKEIMTALNCDLMAFKNNLIRPIMALLGNTHKLIPEGFTAFHPLTSTKNCLLCGDGNVSFAKNDGNEREACFCYMILRAASILINRPICYNGLIQLDWNVWSWRKNWENIFFLIYSTTMFQKTKKSEKWSWMKIG